MAVSSRTYNLSGPPYMAIKEYDENERRSSSEESFRESGFEQQYSTVHRPATLWRSITHSLLLACAMFVAAYLGTRSAVVLSKPKSLGQENLISQPGEITTLSKGTRIPFLEDVPSRPSNFTAHEVLGLPATIESNKAWDALIGPSKGYIEIAHPERYGLPPGVKHPSDPNKGIYGLAMTHELHCLIRIRTAFYDLVEGRLTPEDFHSPPRREVTKLLALDYGAFHLNHCFDYLQDGIRCAAHLDVQYPVMHSGAGILTGERMCKDWNFVVGILENHSFDASNMTL
ncbi:hypothetical protein CERZMDRAFT_92721 [Cercospora zeae-maydis SCOH1-5]|uniref:Uncharacterized protein n=1 Tax=Cercospora zeae-maydis SCOH1-5 TaxID=717836 RepID=A0A6A6FXF6_9PEZI|nr:hypothetical protein CERZMDRAFT_92721 [Cercospora zeae-maydis SCOH1-5]